MGAKKKRQPRYYAVVGRIPEDENCIAFGRSAAGAIAELQADLYCDDDARMTENEKSYGQAMIIEAVFSSRSPIKLEQI